MCYSHIIIIIPTQWIQYNVLVLIRLANKQVKKKKKNGLIIYQISIEIHTLTITLF